MGRDLISQKEMVLISLYIKRSNKGGAFIAPRRVIKSGAYSIAAFIPVAALNRSFTVSVVLNNKTGPLVLECNFCKGKI